MSKYSLAPGLPGYGTRGADGSVGLTGSGMYFSSYSGESDKITIQTKIANNQKLYSSTDPSLSGWPYRTYQNGDVFIDNAGKAYEILSATAGTFTLADVEGISTNLFEYIKIGAAGFSRYANDYATAKVLIDDVLTPGSISDYTTYPETIYGIAATGFTKVQFSNYNPTGIDYNPFTVWTYGTNNHNSLAIVRDKGDNQWRIGNLDPSGFVRNLNIILDASNVIISKDSNAGFVRSQVDGTVLTNHEIPANLLFNPVFTIGGYGNKTNFALVPSGTIDVSVYWNIYDFFGIYPETDSSAATSIVNSLQVNLHFYESSTNAYYAGSAEGFKANDITLTDPSIFITKIFYDIEPSIVVTLKGLKQNTVYGGYLEFINGGFVRNSNRSTCTTNSTPTALSFSIAPTGVSKTAAAGSDTISITASGTGMYWYAFEYLNWLSLGGTTSGSGNGTLSYSYSANTSTTGRGGFIHFNTALGSYYFYISQAGAAASTATVTFNIEGEFDKFNMVTFSGTVYLRNSSGAIISTKYITEANTNVLDRQFTDIPTGSSYYLDFSGLTAYSISGSPIFTYREWKIDGGSYTPGDTTSTFLLTNDVNYWGYLQGISGLIEA